MKGLTIKAIALCILTTVAGSCVTRQSLRQSVIGGESANKPVRTSSLSQYMRAVYKLSSEARNQQIEQRAQLLSQFPELTELATRIERNPGDADAKSQLASAYIDHQLYWAAYELLTELQTANPEDTDTNLNLARIWDVWGEHDLALEHVQRAIDKGDSSFSAYELMGRIHLHRKAPLEAIGWYERAVAQQGSNATVLANLGYAYILVSDWEKAKARLKGAIELDSTLPEPHNNLAVVLTKLGDEKGALSELLKTAKAPVAFNNMGVLYLNDAHLERAQMFFEEALRLDPQYEIAQRNLTAVQAAIPPSVVHVPSFGIQTSTDAVSINCPEPEIATGVVTKEDVPVSVPVEMDVASSTRMVETDSLPAEQVNDPRPEVSKPNGSISPPTNQPQQSDVTVQKAHHPSAGKKVVGNSDMASYVSSQTTASESEPTPRQQAESSVSNVHTTACTISQNYGLTKTSSSRFNLADPVLVMGGIVLSLAAGATAMRLRKRPLIQTLTGADMKKPADAFRRGLNDTGFASQPFPRHTQYSDPGKLERISGRA